MNDDEVEERRVKARELQFLPISLGWVIMKEFRYALVESREEKMSDLNLHNG